MSPDLTDRLSNPNRADASNWRTWPFKRWAFHDVREVVPTVPIATGPGRALPVAGTPASLEGFNLTLLDGASLGLDGFLKATFTDAMVILHRG